MKIIAGDGSDGSGKTTNLKLLVDWLSIDNKKSVEYIQMPGATALGREIRRIVKSKQYAPGPMTERLLFAADMAQASYEKFTSNSANYCVCDRLSTITDLIYGSASGLELGDLDVIQKAAKHNVVADIFIVFKCSFETTQYRKAAMAGVATHQPGIRPEEAECRIEAKGTDYLRRVWKAYDSIVPTTDGAPFSKLNGMIRERAKIVESVNSDQSFDKIQKDLVDLLTKHKII